MEAIPDNDSFLRDFFDIKKSDDEKYLLYALESYKSFFVNETFKRFKMTFTISFPKKIGEEWERVSFDFDPTDIPDSIREELADYIKRRGFAK